MKHGSIAKKYSKQGNFLMVTRDSGDNKNGGRLLMVCSHHGEPRNTRHEDMTTEGTTTDETTDANKKKKRKALTMKHGCNYRIRFARAPSENVWRLSTFVLKHNDHPEAESYSTYAAHRTPTPQQLELILRQINGGSTNRQIVAFFQHDNNRGETMGTVNNNDANVGRDDVAIFKNHDIANIRRRFLGTTQDDTNTMHTFINKLENNGYLVRSMVDKTNTTTAFLFTHWICSARARQLCEVVIIDATYKTNRYRMPFVNIVGVGNVGRDSLMTFAIAGAWTSNEQETTYRWILQQLEYLVYTNGSSPQIIITDNAKSIVNAVEDVFPESTHLLCTVHITRNFFSNINKYFTDKETNSKELEKILQQVYRCRDAPGYFKAFKAYSEFVKANTTDKGTKALEYFSK
jgi:hypothetical protein